jgi:hypothetical protein
MFWVIKSRIIIWAVDVVVGEEGGEEVYTRFRFGNLKGSDHFEDLGGGGRVT